jgi:hypothetical protein
MRAAIPSQMQTLIVAVTLQVDPATSKQSRRDALA